MGLKFEKFRVTSFLSKVDIQKYLSILDIMNLIKIYFCGVPKILKAHPFIHH